MDLEENARDFLKNHYNQNYLNKIKDISESCSLEEVIQGDTYFSHFTYQEVIDSSNLLTQLIQDILEEKIKYGYALIRPPSHHSQMNLYYGFCLVNQTYQCAKYLYQKHDKKVLILDYDVHHGDGTQALVNFDKEDEIYFCSIHGYFYGFFPGTGSEEENNDKVLNLPMPKKSTNQMYLKELELKIKPFITKINPEIIIISNGLDAHYKDRFKIMKLTNLFYQEITRYLKSLNLPLIYILEGGYNTEVISEVSKDIIDILIEE